MPDITPNIDLFCRVIDNFGDAGVAVRLARRFAELGQRVRLWIDQPSTLAQPDDAHRYETRLWPQTKAHAEAPFPNIEPAGRVIALFGARLPDNYLAAMAARATPPIWINLEYLTAETWAVDCHGLASPHPRLPLHEYFFFPGIRSGTGGVICEPALLAEWATFDRAAYLARLGLTNDGKRLISLFSYDTAALDSLITQWRDGDGVRVCTFNTPALPRIARALSREPLNVGDRVRQGALDLHILPWLSQDDYDRLLWSCDLNIVRGEDSFVRAQLAGRPLLWQPYPQAEGAHLIKLNAFLDHYTQGLTENTALALRTQHHAYSLGTALSDPKDEDERRDHALRWRAQIIARGDLATQLIAFSPSTSSVQRSHN